MSQRSRLPSDVRTNAPFRVPTSTRTPLIRTPFRQGRIPPTWPPPVSSGLSQPADVLTAARRKTHRPASAAGLPMTPRRCPLALSRRATASKWLDVLSPCWSGPRRLAALPPAGPGAGRQTPVRVLLLCAGNGSRSQIAEALRQQAAGDRVQVVSAGSHPKELHPDAVRVMRGYGIDLSGRRSKHLSEFSTHRFDYVITLCDRVREVCPEFPGGPEPIHWSIPDPAAASGGPARPSPVLRPP